MISENVERIVSTLKEYEKLVSIPLSHRSRLKFFYATVCSDKEFYKFTILHYFHFNYKGTT